MLVRANLPGDKGKIFSGKIVYDLDVLDIEPENFDKSWMKKIETRGRRVYNKLQRPDKGDR